MRLVSLLTIVTVYLAVCGGISADAQAGPVLQNSIRHLPAASSPSDAVSASPRITGTGDSNAPASPHCAVDAECKFGEFCNGSRGVCLTCRRRRKRCVRDGMCCAGNQCINGVCQPADDVGRVNATQQVGKTDAPTLAVTREKNFTAVQHPKRNTILTNPQHPVKGGEGETCLRSSDCLDGLCCARHFWSRICKPVLTEGQMCTRHRRKGTHGLEIFQRCDCRAGLTCRGQGERAGTESRNLHTCQPR
ncbi:dickkopf WNT signaling pathway inhibitor 1a [Xyrauchen texanus]|uniref:dickkopf WNT signaling pathway inhibitor 1a n=1 Tax=Xyrauchen texanus TaxID=154827 RepID=UPI0022418744|nr:dickkopf WNT signaling pathway inhibitor 1a [Xyrauchen texanus]